MSLFELSKFAVLVSLGISLSQPAVVMACSFCTVPSAPKAEAAPTPAPQPVAAAQPAPSASAPSEGSITRTMPTIGTKRSNVMADSKAFFAVPQEKEEEAKRPVYQITGDQIYSGSSGADF